MAWGLFGVGAVARLLYREATNRLSGAVNGAQLFGGAAYLVVVGLVITTEPAAGQLSGVGFAAVLPRAETSAGDTGDAEIANDLVTGAADEVATPLSLLEGD